MLVKALYCANCTRNLDTATLKPVRVVEIQRTDNHYVTVCATCAIELCDKVCTHRRIDQQSGDNTSGVMPE